MAKVSELEFNYYFQDDVERECPEALKWGVLQDVGEAGSDSQPAYVNFFHKLLQEFAVAWYIFKTTEESLDKTVNFIYLSSTNVLMSKYFSQNGLATILDGKKPTSNWP